MPHRPLHSRTPCLCLCLLPELPLSLQPLSLLAASLSAGDWGFKNRARRFTPSLFLKPQYPADLSLTAQLRDHKRLQRETQLREVAETEATARGENLKKPVGRQEKPPLELSKC